MESQCYKKKKKKKDCKIVDVFENLPKENKTD